MRAFLEAAARGASVCTFIICTVFLCLFAKDVFDHGRVTGSVGCGASLWQTIGIGAFVFGAWVGSLIALAKSL